MTEPTAVETPDAPESGSAEDDSIPRAIAVALGLGLLGPVIALVSMTAVGFATVSIEIPLVVSVIVGLFFGQYVAFGGLSVAYLRSRFDWSGVRSYLGVRTPTLKELGIVLGGWVVLVILLIITSIIVQLLAPTEPASNQSAEFALQNPAIIPLLILAMFLVVGPCEEILYRGVVQGRLRESLSVVPSILIASAVFAAVHVMALTGGLSARLTTIAILFVPSVVFGAVYEYTENIVVPSLLHGLHNAVLFTLLYLSIIYGDELEELGAVLAGVPT
ncbi:MAG: type II CAAX endopeptidase family protein [Natronomonas sp.]